MGMFGFTYADTGTSIIHSSGYIYITKKIQKVINYKKPALKFDYVNGYGDFSIINKHKDVIEIDIYALMAAQIYTEGLCKSINNYNLSMFERYITILNRAINGKVYDEYDFSACSGYIRNFGIEYTNKMNYIKSCPAANFDLPKISNQSAKTVKYKRVCTSKIPMLITKKRLENMIPDNPDNIINKNDDLCDIARKWGMVSGDDPNQGFYLTHNNWVKYIYTENQ